MEIRIVPLRERREDIPYLAANFIREAIQRLNRPLTGMTAAAERTLLEAPWPGNVRELRNVIERACLLSDGKMLTDRDVLAAMPLLAARPGPLLTGARPPVSGAPVNTPTPVNDSDVVIRSRFDPASHSDARARVEHALRAARGNKAAAARLLGISRRTMYRWLKRLALS